MIVVGIYIKDSVTLEYNRVELFSDEKISVNSSIQNVNDISKTYTDFSQTFTVPASKQNNKIFRHWYENSNDNGFSTLTKADAYIEIDTIPFRSGKIQLESANVKDGLPQDYSITFIGALGSLKDKFNGLYLKDLTDTTYDFIYTAANVKTKVTTLTPTSPATPDIAFPLISSNRYWNYGATGTNDISLTTSPIRYNELFPAIKLSAVLNMIQNDSNILNLNFNGSFLTDARFINAYLWLKNSEDFIPKYTYTVYDINSAYIIPDEPSTYAGYPLEDYFWQSTNNTTNTFTTSYINDVPNAYNICRFIYRSTGTGTFDLVLWNVTDDIKESEFLGLSANQPTSISKTLLYKLLTICHDKEYQIRITSYGDMTLLVSNTFVSLEFDVPGSAGDLTTNNSVDQSILNSKLIISKQFPEIKIEDFFSGLLKMFNLTCYSTDGINYTIEQLESYYTSGQIRDITKYIKSDSINLNRVKTYKKINFEYEKSESLVNVGFNSENGIEYGSLFYNTNNDGDEYNIKLPFEDLNFSNLSELLQVGYSLKTDLQKYIPKPVILYDYNPTTLITLTAAADFYFNTNITGGTSTLHTTYKAFGQEYYNGTNTYSLNFNAQQSTLTNEVISNSLYQQYYENYLTNIFDSKARLIKVSGILPTSLLTTLKLNDRLIIRDKRYLINTFTTDLTTGEVQFELLTDFRAL